MSTPYSQRTTINPALLVAYNRGIDRARQAGRTQQAREMGWCRTCGDDLGVKDQHALCQTCRKARASL